MRFPSPSWRGRARGQSRWVVARLGQHLAPPTQGAPTDPPSGAGRRRTVLLLEIKDFKALFSLISHHAIMIPQPGNAVVTPGCDSLDAGFAHCLILVQGVTNVSELMQFLYPIICQ